MRKKIAIIHNKFRHLHKLGGGEAVALWVIEALKRDYDVTLVASFAPTFWDDLAVLNDRFGTSLKRGEFSIHNISEQSRFRRIVHDLFWVVRICTLMREARKLRPHYDLLFSTFNEMDLGGRGIQYIHFPTLASIPVASWRDWLKYPYRALAPHMLGCRAARMKKNVTLANSGWTAAYVRERYGIDARVVYPPVPAFADGNPWSERKNGFVCLGRMSREKRLEDVIAIGDALRAQGHDIHIHFVGPEHDAAYVREIRDMARTRAWVLVEGAVSRERLEQLLAEHKWGIHGMKEEHFGIAVAEIVRAGCIMFVPNGGGQVEIVNRDDRLIYNDLDDAAKKIGHLLVDERLQADMRGMLRTHAQQFSSEHFMQEIKRIVAAQCKA